MCAPEHTEYPALLKSVWGLARWVNLNRFLRKRLPPTAHRPPPTAHRLPGKTTNIHRKLLQIQRKFKKILKIHSRHCGINGGAGEIEKSQKNFEKQKKHRRIRRNNAVEFLPVGHSSRSLGSSNSSRRFLEHRDPISHGEARLST